MPVRIQKLTFPKESLEGVPVEDRYTYLTLGHMFNELMALQRLLSFSLPRDEDVEPAVRDAKFGQAMLVLRVTAGKLYEAHKALDAREMSGSIRTRFLPLLSDGADRWKRLRDAKRSVGWLNDVRNDVAFHFPTFSETAPLLAADGGAEIEVYGDSRSGNTFHKTSEGFALSILFKTARDVEHAHQMIGDVIGYLTEFNDFLEAVLAEYASTHFPAPLVGAPVDVEALRFIEFSLPAYLELS